MRVAIHQNKKIFNHSTLWTDEWINYCITNDIDYGIVNAFDNNFLNNMKDYDMLLWHFSHYSLQEMQFARSIINVLERKGTKVFPDYNTAWHFDDKISEAYLLKSIGAPIPKSWIFYSGETAIEFFKNRCEYPIVAKLKCGSGSNNVKLLKNYNDALTYTKKMFGTGIKSTPSILYKTKSNIQSSKSLKMALLRLKRIPDFVESISKTKKFQKEKGYVFLQEYIPNDGYDLKVVVVGDQLSFLARDVRKGDFRASGGGSINYKKNLLSQDIIDVSFQISEELGFQCMGFDFVVDKRDNKGKIVEISYGFSHTAQMGLGGYWNKEGKWYEIPLNAPVEVLRNLINDIGNYN